MCRSGGTACGDWREKIILNIEIFRYKNDSAGTPGDTNETRWSRSCLGGGLL